MTERRIFNLLILISVLSALHLFHPCASGAASPVLWQQISQQGSIKSINPAVQETQISAIVGQGIFTIEGWTSPQATVKLTNSQGNISKQTTQANAEGYFIFINVLLPKNPGELWLQATDKKNLINFPLALPQPPPGINKIENIILSPTLAQINSKFLKNSQSFAWGYGIADSQIEINLFKKPRFSLFRQAFAQQPLKFKVNANQNGYFEFNLPNQTLADYKIFAGNIFQDNYSPKSTILSFRVLAWWERLWQQIISLATKLALELWAAMHDLLFWIGVEILILILLIKKRGSTWYYVTICTQNRKCMFGKIINNKIELNEFGKIVDKKINELKKYKNVDIDIYCVMPNHVHFIIRIEGAGSSRPNPTLGQIVAYFKYQSTKQINDVINGSENPTNDGRENPAPTKYVIKKIWQRNYYEHIIRNETELGKIREYITLNPTMWDRDRNNLEKLGI